MQRTPSPKHLGASPHPWPPLTAPAPHLCPVLQPLVELKYPVVGLVPIWRVPPAQRAEQAVGGGAAMGWGGVPSPQQGTHSPSRAGHSPSNLSPTPVASSMPALLRCPRCRHELPADPHTYPIPGSRYVGGYMGVGLRGAKKQAGQHWWGCPSLPTAAPPSLHSSGQAGSLEARPHAWCGLHPGCRWPRGATCTPEAGFCSRTGGCSTTPGTWPVARGDVPGSSAAGPVPGGMEVGEGAASAGAGSTPCPALSQGLDPTELRDLGAPFIPNTTLSPPSPTRACSDPVSPLAVTQLYAPQSLYTAGEHDRETPDLADPCPGPSSPHISIQHGARVEGGEGVAVRGLLWRVQLERLRGTAWRERGGTQVSRGHSVRRDLAARRRKRKDARPAKPPSAQPHPSSALQSLHPTYSSRPSPCRMGPTESGLSCQDQQPEGPGPIPGISHWCPEFVSSQLAGLRGRCPRVQLVSRGRGGGWALSSP